MHGKWLPIRPNSADCRPRLLPCIPTAPPGLENDPQTLNPSYSKTPAKGRDSHGQSMLEASHSNISSYMYVRL